MTNLIQIEDFDKIFLSKTPLLDVRAPNEFQKGAFPCSHNSPLLTNSEREAVGTRYRQQGREAAIKLGQELVVNEVREQRLQAWKSFCSANPTALLYCFRGGLRSAIVQQWLAESGVEIPRIAGGYKALRRYLLGLIQSVSANDNLLVIAGKTGSGKTHILNSLDNSLDLEGFAQHRGSAFGRRAQTQPSQVDFENKLAIRLLDLSWQKQQRVVVEDESRAIGSLSIPHTLHQRMLLSPLALIEESLENRINTIHMDYIQSNYQDFLNADAENADCLFADSLTSALLRIRRRLGDEAYTNINAMMDSALKEQFSNGSIEGHRIWISELLNKYYDPMYEYQLGKKAKRIVFRGSRDELLAWIQPLVAEKAD